MKDGERCDCGPRFLRGWRIVGSSLWLTVSLASPLAAGNERRLDHAGTSGNGGVNLVRRAGEPDYVRVRCENRTWADAIRTARRTVPVFERALRSPRNGQGKFSVKKPFRQGKIVEHIWLSGLSYDGRLFHGRVANDPVDVKGVKLGDEASVAPSDLSDWMFADNGKLVGGYTIRVLFKGFSPMGRKRLMRQFGLKIE